MLNPNLLVDALVAVLRDIPELVAALGGDSASIFAYQDQFPISTDIALAIAKQPQNTLMVFWRSSGPGSQTTREVWSHRLAVTIKAADPAAIWVEIVNGVPASGDTRRLTRVEVHPACYPMDTPSIDRRSILIGQEAIVEYLEASITYKEKGDF